MSKKRAVRQAPVGVLIADDHPVTRRGIREILKTDPTFRVVGEADDGKETLRLVKILRPELAVLDISMPKPNGIDLTRQLRRETTEVKVVILSIHFSKEVARECLRAGARAYVLKSDPDEQVLAALRAVRDDQPFLTPRIAELFETNKPLEDCDADAPRGLDGEIPPERLTQREQQILKMLCEGRSSSEVASEIGISTRTIESQRGEIKEKLRLTTFSSLVRYAIRHGIVPA
jgi:DNA-binding NarL/FixJ family response regulator